MQVTLESLNVASTLDFIATLGSIFEHAPWVAEGAAARRPFATVTALHEAMLDVVREAPVEQTLAFLRGHPELAGQAAVAGTMGEESTSEQAGLGLQRPGDDTAVIAGLNAAYGERFGFPFIVSVRRRTRPAILSEFRRRLTNDAATEREAALREIGFITRLRLVDRVTGPGMPVVEGSLTTHVLDAGLGRPAVGITVELFEVGSAGPIATAITDEQGRTERPLLSGAPLRIGVYELHFHIGAHFQGRLPDDPPFLDVIPIRFGIAEPEAHYHVPLLVSPGAYSTYRGS